MENGCALKNLTKSVITHYVGVTGNEYPKEEYCTWGNGKTRFNKKDLPLNEYPYTYKYEAKQRFKCCELCDCKK